MFVEIKSQPARDFIASLMATKRLLLAPRIARIDTLALKIFETVNSDPSLPSIDPPEAYALALAAHVSAPLLTDNAAPKLAVAYIVELRGTRVLDSLDVLALLYGREELQSRVNEFMQDTGLVFSRRRLEEYGLRPREG